MENRPGAGPSSKGWGKREGNGKTERKREKENKLHVEVSILLFCVVS